MNKQKRTRRLAVVAVAGLVALAVSPAASQAAPLYPDLRMMAPTDLRILGIPQLDGSVHRRLQFTSRVWNVGEGAFEVDRTPTSDTTASLSQRIYDSNGTFTDEPLASSVEFLPLDFTFAVPAIGRYELWAYRDYLRARSRDFRRGAPLMAREASYCVADVEQVDPDQHAGAYATCTKFVTGISAGWADVTGGFEPENQFQLGTGTLADGEYVLRAIADPHNRLHESPGKADPAREGPIPNSSTTYFRLLDGEFVGGA